MNYTQYTLGIVYEARFYAGFRNLSQDIRGKLHYPKSVCIVLILYKESIKRAFFNTQYTARFQSVYCVRRQQNAVKPEKSKSQEIDLS